ncbi:hypothetical protein [Pseudomonas sp. D1-1]|uniref:hypothetical protein n=1 Tax=Pseudomonas sp. D1-1 TaxID=1040793 RepID=UPI003DA9A3F6
MLNSVIGLAAQAVGGIVNSGISPLKNTGSSNASPSLSGVVSQLANSMMSGGKPDFDSPLGKMVKDKLSEKGGMGLMGMASNPQETLKNALMDVVKDKMGSNFIANAGGRDSKDLMGQVVGGLAQSALNNALERKGDGTTFSKADKPLLQQVADYMDKNKATFGAPDSGSWSKELDEDNYLSTGETAKFKQAIEQVAQHTGGSGSRTDYPGVTAGGQGGLGSSPAPTSGGMSDIEQVRQMIKGSEGMEGFQQGLQLGLGIASDSPSGLAMNQGEHTAAHAAQNVLDVMRASVT